MYISYSKIHAADSCSPVGPTITNTIVPIPTDTPVSSQWAELLDSTFFMPGLPAITKGTASFNVTDMHEPVPYSIYSRQPWCASWLGTNVPVVVNNSGTLSTKSCPTADPYQPIIYLPSHVLNELHPAWASCSADVRGMYDPPLALTEVKAIAQPTAPTEMLSHSALPSSVPNTPTPAPTVSLTEAAGEAIQESVVAPTQSSSAALVSLRPTAEPLLPSVTALEIEAGVGTVSQSSYPCVVGVPGSQDVEGLIISLIHKTNATSVASSLSAQAQYTRTGDQAPSKNVNDVTTANPYNASTTAAVAPYIPPNSTTADNTTPTPPNSNNPPTGTLGPTNTPGEAATAFWTSNGMIVQDVSSTATLFAIFLAFIGNVF